MKFLQKLTACGNDKDVKLWGKLFLLITVLIISGCSTAGHFIIPEGTQLEINKQLVDVGPSGKVVTRPFFWNSSGIAPQGGCSYLLLKDDKVIKEGNLRVVFRGVSLFWPPYAFIYWPMGLNPNITYDLVNDTQK